MSPAAKPSVAPPTRAVLLAAGRGRRLGGESPKCLLSIGGKSLLERHVTNLVESNIRELVLVVGFERGRIERALAALKTPLRIDVVVNERFLHGSIVSLDVAIDRLSDGGIWMDADVLYPPALLRRLVSSKHENCVLLDGRSEESGEEMMVGTRGGRVVTIARRVGPGWDFAGESVGFARVGPSGARVMKRILDEEVAAERLDQEYEAAMDRAFEEVPFGFERIDDLPWTEIDFPEDVEKATAIARSM